MNDTEIHTLLARTRAYLTTVLLPFWIERSPDPEFGGFLTWFDRNGQPTGETTKTFLMQIRMLYTMSSAHRAGYGDGRCGELARMGAGFIADHYWDDQYGGWYWIADRYGQPTVTAKIGYGQCFAMYAFGEYFLATGDALGREVMERTYNIIRRCMADERRGGYLEIFERDWQPAAPGTPAGDRKSFDVHMHMMEALTKVLEVTGSREHQCALREIVDLITSRMLDRVHRTGLLQFSLDFTPLAPVPIDVEWGRDEGPREQRPIDLTSYGHNVEFAWLLLRAADALGVPRSTYADTIASICDHCVGFGIDHEFGGVYIEGPVEGTPTTQHKQFWQQAEVLVGMLDAWALLDDDRYWGAFVNVYAFVFDKFVALRGGGEWYALVDRDGTPLWDYLGDAWKISYHTVRSMIEVVRLLEKLDSDPQRGGRSGG